MNLNINVSKNLDLQSILLDRIGHWRVGRNSAANRRGSGRLNSDVYPHYTFSFILIAIIIIIMICCGDFGPSVMRIRIFLQLQVKVEYFLVQGLLLSIFVNFTSSTI